ncbi:MAG: GntR family transcriptional regulator [Candidatus Aminicenantes bacterium]|nr:GntR family transcriptional regulator [Candidatus Aminicenantes bacterium]
MIKGTLGKNISFSLPATLSDTIYKYLKNSIIEGRLEPSQRLQEKDIAEFFQASTTPVREAFQRLAAEKFIIIAARKEVIVASVTLQEIRELFAVVRVLDAFASKLAVPNLKGKDIAELKKRTKKLDVFYQQKKINPYVEENLKIHDKIWQSCGNKFLYQSLVNLAEKYTFYANQVFFLTDKSEGHPSFLDGSHRDHMDLMAAIETGNEKEVEKILLSHWGDGYLEEGKTDVHKLLPNRGGDAKEGIHVSKMSRGYKTKTTF